jgi:hypothetical protein
MWKEKTILGNRVGCVAVLHIMQHLRKLSFGLCSNALLDKPVRKSIHIHSINRKHLFMPFRAVNQSSSYVPPAAAPVAGRPLRALQPRLPAPIRQPIGHLPSIPHPLNDVRSAAVSLQGDFAALCAFRRRTGVLYDLGHIHTLSDELLGCVHPPSLEVLPNSNGGLVDHNGVTENYERSIRAYLTSLKGVITAINDHLVNGPGARDGSSHSTHKEGVFTSLDSLNKAVKDCEAFFRGAHSAGQQDLSVVDDQRTSDRIPSDMNPPSVPPTSVGANYTPTFVTHNVTDPHGQLFTAHSAGLQTQVASMDTVPLSEKDWSAALRQCTTKLDACESRLTTLLASQRANSGTAGTYPAADTVSAPSSVPVICFLGF